MSAYVLLEQVKVDSIGRETALRVMGGRTPPPKMTIQIQIAGAASVQLQGRVAKEAPWTDIGDMYVASALAYIEPIPFLRANTSGMSSDAAVSVWATWGWL